MHLKQCHVITIRSDYTTNSKIHTQLHSYFIALIIETVYCRMWANKQDIACGNIRYSLIDQFFIIVAYICTGSLRDEKRSWSLEVSSYNSSVNALPVVALWIGYIWHVVDVCLYGTSMSTDQHWTEGNISWH